MRSLLHVQPQRRCVKFIVYTANIQEEIEKKPYCVHLHTIPCTHVKQQEVFCYFYSVIIKKHEARDFICFFLWCREKISFAFEARTFLFKAKGYRVLHVHFSQILLCVFNWRIWLISRLTVSMFKVVRLILRQCVCAFIFCFSLVFLSTMQTVVNISSQKIIVQPTA